MVDSLQLTRRQTLRLMATGVVANALSSRAAVSSESNRPKTGMGLVIYCANLRRRSQQQSDPTGNLFAPSAFLEHCRTLGAGGMQAALGTMDDAACESLKRQASDAGLFIEAIIKPPKDDTDASRFESEVVTAARVSALAARTVIIPGRRYEKFKSLAQFRAAEQRGQAMIERAVPIVEKHRLPLAIENHKDQRNDERVALLEAIDSQYVGACVDTGNSVALLEDPMETVKVLAPWAKSVHIKDQAVQRTDDGFLLADIPLGQGALKLPAMVEILKQANPAVRFSLELITRDPLRVPCLAESYWKPFEHVPAPDLAHTLRWVAAHESPDLPTVSDLPQAEQVAVEDANVNASIEYAGRLLGL